jgi:hypothetical protein
MDYDYHASGGWFQRTIASTAVDTLAALIGRAFDLMLGDRLRLSLNAKVSPAHSTRNIGIGGRFH